MRAPNIIALGNSGTGKSHIALGLGLAACQKGLSVGFTTAAVLVHELIEARDEKRLLRLQRQLAGHKLLIVDGRHSPMQRQVCSQMWFDPILQSYARAFSHFNLRYRTRPETFEQGDDGVTAEIVDLQTGRHERVEAAYLVGCDGACWPPRRARSAVGMSKR